MSPGDSTIPEETYIHSDNLRDNQPAAPGLPLAKNPKIAVFGGSFDPVHSGHIGIAAQVVKLDLADEVLFVPAHSPPHKPERSLTASEHRMQMLKIALQDYEQFSITDIELKKSDSPSYTIDTLDTLNRAFPDCEILFLMGMDSLRELHSWHRASELVHHFRFLVFSRPGYLKPGFGELTAHFGPTNAQKLLKSIIPISTDFTISSTNLREKIGNSGETSGKIPPEVQHYITEHKLYTDE